MKAEPESSYAVVFSGGGALGAWEIGCLKALVDRHGAPPTVVTGASAGAINAAGLCAGLSAETLEDTWTSLRPEEVYLPSVGLIRASWIAFRLLLAMKVQHRTLDDAFSRLAGQVQSILDTSPLKNKLEGILAPVETDFFSSDTRFAISLTDLENSRKRIHYKPIEGFEPPNSEWQSITDLDSLVAAVMGTAAIPVLFPPYRGLFDGGILRNQPIGPAIEFGATLIYVLIPTTEAPQQPTNVLETASILLGLWVSTSLGLQLQLTAAENRIRSVLGKPPIALHVVRPSQDLTDRFGVGLLSFGQKVRDLINSGEEDACSQLKAFDVETP